MLASSCPMNAPRHTAPTAAHGARGCSRTHCGRRDSRVNGPRSKLLMNTIRFCHRQKPNNDTCLVVRIQLSGTEMDTDGTAQRGAFLPVSYTHLRAHETVLDLVCR